MPSPRASLSDDEEDFQPINFHAYVRKAHRLDNNRPEGELHQEFEQLLLEGKGRRGHRFRLDTTEMKTNLGIDDTSISLHRDYDSLIGFYARLPFFGSVELGLVPRPMDVLSSSSNLHITLPNDLFCIDCEPEEHPAAPHQIANYCLGKYQANGLIRIFFPYLTGMPNNRVDEAHISEFYDNVLRPALINITPHSASSFPPYRLLDGILSRTKDGKLVGGRRLCPAGLLDDLVRGMRENLQTQVDNLRWARSFFFGLEVKGIKLSTTHQVPFDNNMEQNANVQEDCFKQILGLFQTGLSSQEQKCTWVDVGLEVKRVGYVLHWDASEHHNILAFLAQGYQGEIEQRWTQPGRDGYFSDIQAGILSLAGGRCALPHHRGLPVYAQWYASEKIVARTADRFHPMLGITKKKVLGEKTRGQLEGEFDHLEEIWNSAHEAGTEGTARMEIRVPLRRAKRVLKEATKEFVELCTISVPTGYWWLYKLLTARACRQMIEAQLAGSRPSRRSIYALQLTAALIWRVNMLNSRPAVGSSEHALMCACLPITENFLHPDLLDGCDRNPWRDQAEGEEYRPMAPGNVLWFRDIDYQTSLDYGQIAPAFKSQSRLGILRPPTLNTVHLKHLLGFSSEEIQIMLTMTPYVTPQAPRRLPRPRFTLPPPSLEPQDQMPANPHVILRDHTLEHLIAASPRPRLFTNAGYEVPPLNPGTNSILYTKTLQQIIEFYFSNVLQTIPSPQSPSLDQFYHIVRDPQNRIEHPGMEYFTGLDLHESGFTGAHIRKRNPPEFHVAFQLSFPPATLMWEPPIMQGTYNRDRRAGQNMEYGDGRAAKGKMSIKERGWQRHSFHQSWWEFITKFDVSAGHRIRVKIWERMYSKLVWVPYSDLSRMWYTTSHPKSAETFPADMEGNRLPILILNPLIDDKAMWDGLLIRRGEWVSPLLQQ